MIVPLLLLLASAPQRVAVAAETLAVPAKDWRAVDFALRQRPAVVECNFHVTKGKADVRIALVARGDIEAGRIDRALAATGWERAGTFRARPPGLGEYALVVDNRGEDRAVEVKLDVWFDFGRASFAPVRTLSPRRRGIIVGLTLLLFAGVVLYAGRRLTRAVRMRP